MGVTLTKDNLARKNWHGIHLVPSIVRMKQFDTCFFDSLYAKFLWRAIYIVLGIRPPLDVFDLFHRWYKQERGINNSLLLVGAATICWSIWLTRNGAVFDKCQPKTFLQVLFRGMHWLQTLGTVIKV
jgi:hypothetical protein